MSIRHITSPTRVEAAGTPPKLIDEYVGRVNSDTTALSVAHMRSPAGWEEPGQTPEFDEYTVVLTGALLVRHDAASSRCRAGQAVITPAGEWVQYFDARRRRVHRRVRSLRSRPTPSTATRRCVTSRLSTARDADAASRIASSSASAAHGSTPKWTASMPNARAPATLSALSSRNTASLGVDRRGACT